MIITLGSLIQSVNLNWGSISTEVFLIGLPFFSLWTTLGGILLTAILIIVIRRIHPVMPPEIENPEAEQPASAGKRG